jgi:hypothetical protein
MDFARPRGGHGPGRMSKAQALAHIALADGENFGEDTAIVFDPISNYAVTQYNHFGPRITAIENYLSSYDFSLGGIREPQNGERAEDTFGYVFGAVLKPDALARLRGIGILREISFAVAVPGARTVDLEAGRSLGDVLRAPLPEGVETISISISATATKNSHLGNAGVMGIVADLQRLGSNLHKAIVRGKPTLEDKIEEVDLIEERLSTTADLTVGAGRRYSRDDRWRALHHALDVWRREGQLAVPPQ